MLKCFQMFVELSMNLFRKSPNVGEKGSEERQLFREQVNLLLKPFVLLRQNLDPFLRLPGPHLRLLPALSDRNVVPLTSPFILVRSLVHVLQLFAEMMVTVRVRMRMAHELLASMISVRVECENLFENRKWMRSVLDADASARKVTVSTYPVLSK